MAQLLPRDLVGTRLEKIEGSYIGTQMVERREKKLIKIWQLTMQRYLRKSGLWHLDQLAFSGFADSELCIWLALQNLSVVT